MMQLRRSDREITNIEEIVDLINRCQTIHIGMVDENKPYIVAMSYGFEIINDRIIFYTHGAKVGRKKDIILKNNNVFIELDILHNYVNLGMALTADYESVTGEATMSIVEDAEEKIKAIKLLCEHCGFKEYDAKACIKKDITEVFKIEVTQIVAKRRFKKVE